MNHIERYYTDEFFNYKDGFAAGLIDFLIYATTNTDCTNGTLEDDWWSYGYIDAYNYYYNCLIQEGSFDLNNILNTIDILYFNRVADNNINKKEKYPAFILKLVNKNE